MAGIICRALIVAWIAGLTGQLAAQQRQLPLVTPKLSEAVRKGWLRGQIVSGRITFTGSRLGNMNDQADDNGRSERLSIRVAGASPSISYQMSGPDDELSIEIIEGDQLHISRGPKGDSGLTAVDFRQPSAPDPPQLTVGSEQDRREYRASSLWHLLIAEPKICRQHLLPLLIPFGEQWDLTMLADQIEANLIRVATNNQLPDRGRWIALLEQLGDPRFSRRQAADRELRALGRVSLTFLRDLDQQQLDAEQRYRIRRIVTTLSGNTRREDPMLIADWLSGDPAVWLSLLQRNDEDTRRQAAQWLEALLGRSIQFDPAADAETRAAQIQRLRAGVLGQ